MILTTSLVMSQEQNLIVREKINIPFTCNSKVDQYMADYQSLVLSTRFLLTYGQNKDSKQLVNKEYQKFTSKYTNITTEIKTLDHQLQKLVAGFINAKGTELADLMSK